MPRMMDGEQLRQLFCSDFDLQRWKTFIADFFAPGELRGVPEPIPAPEGADAGYYLGAMMTGDSYRIGFFVYTVSEGSVSHRRDCVSGSSAILTLCGVSLMPRW